jgi:glycerol uptake facilitator-like aquaporin
MPLASTGALVRRVSPPCTASLPESNHRAHRGTVGTRDAGLRRRMLAEFVGTGALVTAVVGSGIMASRLSPHDAGMRLVENSAATVLALGALIVALRPVSGAHFNPVVSVADWWLGRAAGTGITAKAVGCYVSAQVIGAIGGSVLANLMFGLDPVTWSHTERSAGNLWLGEAIATAGLVALVFVLVRADRGDSIPVAVSAYIGAACWFTSSTSFANPAVTVGRAFTDTYAGIAPASLPGFVLAQAAGAAVGVVLALALYPRPPVAGPTALPPRQVRTESGGGIRAR